MKHILHLACPAMAVLCAFTSGCTQESQPLPLALSGPSTGGAPLSGAPLSGTGGVAGAGGSGTPTEGSGGLTGTGDALGSGGAAAVLGPAQILCVGDSITENSASWMHPLAQHLMEVGCEPFDFIGYDQSPYNGPYEAPEGQDAQRIAAGGFSSRGILNWIESKAGDLGGVPDFWIQYLGVNNVYGGFIDGTYNPSVTSDPDGAYLEDTEAFIDLVRAKNPSAHFLLVKIQDGKLPEIDAAIDETVLAKNTPESPVIAVDAAYSVSTTDGIHPDEEGAKTLAAPIAARLTELMMGLGFCAPGSSHP